ncbi:hypothetical protein CMV_016907 [Castanea mollissima]|uniref:Uncharacterized protein n=1 Tax=Castanea mollissima TaxID=60419 RepID=A0A8J4VIZ2_9ROSI|nr:hypothetical protein CMV_016907 [Castanea mollissima]
MVLWFVAGGATVEVVVRFVGLAVVDSWWSERGFVKVCWDVSAWVGCFDGARMFQWLELVEVEISGCGFNLGSDRWGVAMGLYSLAMGRWGRWVFSHGS